MANIKLKKSSSSEGDGLESWSNLNHDMLFVIMMRVGVFDFIALSGVCKSWRSVALSNWNKFMVCKQPMKLTISTRLYKKDLYLEEDYTRRKFKTTIPRSNGRVCLGVTCGYLIFFGKITHDFWLVNPLTRKELHFPGFPITRGIFQGCVMGILVFSPSMSGWVFVVSHIGTNGIYFSLAGKQARWRSVYSNSDVRDLHFFKGKIYMINTSNHLWELRLNPEPTLTLHKIKDCPWPHFRTMKFVSSGENLYVRDLSRRGFKAIDVDIDEMKWVNAKRTIGEYAVFLSDLKCYAAIKPDTWAHPWAQYERLNCFRSTELDWLKLWYFPHDCLYIDSDMENGPLLNVLKE